MSTTQTEKNRSDVSDVIARSLSSEPVVLHVVSMSAGRVEVTRDNPRFSIRLPEEDVYRFDQRMLSELKDAYAAGDRARLDRLWGQAERLGK